MSFFNPFFSKNKPHDEALLDAIKKDDSKKVEQLLNPENINQEDDEFKTPLYHAFNHGSFRVTRFLLENGATYEDTIDSNSIITHLVLSGASPEMIRYLHEKGASVSSPYGINPVEMAIQEGRSLEVFQTLTEFTEVKESEGQKSLIHQVVDSEKLISKDKAEILRLLTDQYGYELNEKSNQLPLGSKLFNKQDFDLLAECIKLGLSINGISEHLIKFLGEKKMKELGPYIVRHANVNQDKYFLPILEKGAFKSYLESLDDVSDKGIIRALVLNQLLHDKERVELAKLALDKGANINETTNDNNPSNALSHYVRNYHIGKNTLFVEFLLDNGANIEQEGISALFDAVMSNDHHLTKLLLDRGADVNFVNYFDNTILNCVIYPEASFENESQRIDMLKLLLQYGVDLNIPISHYKNETNNATPFLEAVIDLEYSELGQYLMDNFDLEVTDRTILKAITGNINIELAKSFIAKKPQVVFTDYFYCNVRDTYFDTGILPVAIHNDKKELAEYILATYENIVGHQENAPLPIIALRCEYSHDFVKRLIDLDPNINRLYYYTGKSSNDDITQNILSRLLKDNQDLDEEVRLEIGEYLLKQGADPHEPLRVIHGNKSSLNEEGIIICAMNHSTFETRTLSMVMAHGVDPNKPVSNLNESQIQSIVNRYGAMKDAMLVQYLDFFWDNCGVDLTWRNNFGTTILLGAAMQCRPKTIKWLADKGADVHAIGGFDNSPALHKAISNYSYEDKLARAETVQALIDYGADIGQFDSEQFTPLMSAANYGCFESVVCLLKNGANPDVLNEAGEAAAHRAILGQETYDDPENPELVRSKILAVLKDAGANMNVGSDDQLPPLSLAIVNEQKELFNILLQLEVNINQPDMAGRTPLMLAVAYGDQYFINKLMNNKEVEMDTLDMNNESIHFSAVMRSNEEEGVNMLKYFLDQNIPIGEGKDGMNLLHVAVYYVNLQAVEIIKGLGYDINQPDINGFSPLFWVAYSRVQTNPQKRLHMLQLLLESGADLHHQLEDGANALALAVLAGQQEVADALIATGINVNSALRYVEQVEGIDPQAVEYLKSNC